jgi:carbonic anhydrase
MTNIERIMEHNKSFVASKGYEPFISKVQPRRKLAILSCMDTRLTELLPAALGLKNGDAKIIKNAGAVVTDPFGATMRSLMISVYLLGAEEIFIIGHKECGVKCMDASNFTEKMTSANVTSEKIDLVKSCGIDLEAWLRGFEDTDQSVRDTVKMVKGHPLLPATVGVHGFVIDPNTGELERVDCTL